MWSRAANSLASREVLPFGLGLEKPKWELWQTTARACLSTLSVATNRVRLGHSLARWGEWMDSAKPTSAQPKYGKLFHILDAKNVSLAEGTCVFLSFFSISDHPLHSTWSSGTNYSLARMEPRVLACGGWALGILECTTGSRHRVRRCTFLCTGVNHGWYTNLGALTDSVSFCINTSRTPIVDIEF